MLKVLIADDEVKVGKLIQALICWDDLGLELVGIYTDGKSAWEAICEHQPDIVITDIRMPVISGLDLVKQAAEQKMPTQFIIVSGYRYFEYAHKALQYGVEEYLLKPIEEDKLNDALRHIVDLHEEKCAVDRMQQNLQNERGVLDEDFLKAVMKPGLGQKEQEELCNKYGVELNGSSCSAFYIRVDRLPDVPRSHLQEKAILEALLDIVKNEAKMIGLDIVTAGQAGLNILILISWHPEQKEQVRILSHNLMRRLREYFSSYRDYVPTLGMSNLETEQYDYAEVLAKAKKAADQRLFLGVNRRIKAENLPESTISSQELFIRYSKVFLRGLEAMQPEDANQAVKDCFGQAGANEAAGYVYYELCQDFLRILVEHSSSEKGNEDWQEWYENLYNLTDLNTLLKTLNCQIENYIKEYREARAKKDSMPIRETVQYMRKHYAEKLQLDDFAAKYYFNTTYFSELFKKETGKNFTDYLTEVRMEAAKEILRDTRMPIHALAEKVGYRDSKYFSQLFTKLVGIKPVEYRRLYQ